MLTQSYLESAFSFYVSEFSNISFPPIMLKENFFSNIKTFTEADIITLNNKPRYRWVTFWGQEKKYPYWYGPGWDWYTFWNYYRCFIYWDPIPFDWNSWLCYRFVLEKTPTNNFQFLREMDYTTAYLLTLLEFGISLACLNYFLIAWDPQLKSVIGREYFYDIYMPILDHSISWSYQFLWVEPGLQTMRWIHFNIYV